MVGPLSYLGGKNRVAQKIIALIPEHNCYIEPFCGGAQVFFHKEPSNVEVLNDLNEEIFKFPAGRPVPPPGIGALLAVLHRKPQVV